VQRSFGQIAGVVGNGGIAAGGGVVPDLMTAGGLAVEFEAEFLQLLDDLPVLK